MWRASRSLSQSAALASSIRTSPRSGSSAPAATRASVDLPAPDGPIDPQDLARRQRQRDILEDEGVAARVAHRDADQFEPALGIGQQDMRGVGRVGLGEQLVERRERAARLGQRRPLRDDLLERLERAAEQHRGGDDRADRNLALDREQGADAERHRLHEHPHELDQHIVARAGELQLASFRSGRCGDGSRAARRPPGACPGRGSARRCGWRLPGRDRPRHWPAAAALPPARLLRSLVTAMATRIAPGDQHQHAQHGVDQEGDQRNRAGSTAHRTAPSPPGRRAPGAARRTPASPAPSTGRRAPGASRAIRRSRICADSKRLSRSPARISTRVRTPSSAVSVAIARPTMTVIQNRVWTPRSAPPGHRPASCRWSARGTGC